MRGDHSLAAAIALAKGNEALAGIRVIDLLTCLPRIGQKKAEALMDEVGIASSRRIRGLGPHQVTLLVERVAK
jgi:ribosomal protein S13